MRWKFTPGTVHRRPARKIPSEMHKHHTTLGSRGFFFPILPNDNLHLSSLVISSISLLLMPLISHHAIVLHALSLSTSSSCLSFSLSLAFFNLRFFSWLTYDPCWQHIFLFPPPPLFYSPLILSFLSIHLSANGSFIISFYPAETEPSALQDWLMFLPSIV